MTHPDDYRFMLENGCEDVSRTLGIKAMPEGYALLLNADQSHFFWMEKSTGRESSIHWNKWAVYRGAVSDAKRISGGNDNGR